MSGSKQPSDYENYVVEIDTASAAELGDLWLILTDLDFVLSVLTNLRKLIRGNSQDSILMRSLWTAALVKYFRCFGVGVGKKLNTDIFACINGGLECHQYFQDLRNKSVVHDVNPVENCKVGLILSPAQGTKREVLGVAHMLMQSVGPAEDGVESLYKLVAVAKEKADRLRKVAEAKILREAGDLSPAELDSLPRLRLDVPGRAQYGTSRKSWKPKRA